MRNMLLRTLLSLVILPPCAVVAQTNAYAYGYFYAPDGSLALVNIVRTQDATTRVVTTELYYTFCGRANLGVACQQGDGVIPHGNTSGGVYTNVNTPDVFSVNVDTSAVAGFSNRLCTGGVDDYGDCLGMVPATGGLVAVTWTRTNAWANVETSGIKQYRLGKLTNAGSSLLEVFSATEAGTVLGVSAAGDATMVTSSESQTLLEKFQARKALKK